MASGQGNFPWPLATTTGHGQWQGQLAMGIATGQGIWPGHLARGTGRGQWPSAVAMAIDHGHGLWLLALAIFVRARRKRTDVPNEDGQTQPSKLPPKNIK